MNKRYEEIIKTSMIGNFFLLDQSFIYAKLRKNCFLFVGYLNQLFLPVEPEAW